ncbi:hypothetical protein C0992_008323 [Termitomyces sp. T32_za158]|nr:hypothetical protein C0992_008323 [Termitomyces sp. T32_za158]
MAPRTSSHVPTAPRKMPIPKNGRPHVVITTSPPKPASPPPDFYGLLNKSVKRDAHRVILAVLQRPSFAHAAIGLCKTAQAFPGTAADRVRFLSTVGWVSLPLSSLLFQIPHVFVNQHFADQADFPVLADQKGLPDAFSAILPLLDRRAAEEAPDVKAFFTLADAIVAIEAGRREARQKELEEARRRAQDKDVVMLGPSSSPASKRKANVSFLASKLDVISRRLDMLSLTLAPSQTEPEGKPWAKKLKVLPTLTSLKLDSEAVLALLGQVNTALKALPSATKIAAQQQLHALDISFQTFKFISARLSCLDAALGPSEVDQAGSLLNALNVLFSSSNDDSDVEFQDPPQDDSESAVEVSAATAV